MSDPEYPADQPLDTRDLPLLLGAGLGLYLALSAIGPGLDGPSYLVAFTVMWVFLMFVHTAARRVWRDSFAVSVVAAAVLMGVAFARYRWGVERGMQRWGLLIAMTILGCAVFFVRVSQPRPGAARDRADDRFSRTGCGTATGGCGSDTAGGCGASTGGGGCGGGSGGGCGGCGGGGCGG